jgi:hypothetical protein
VILTTAPNDLLRRVHDRMPVVIPEGLEEAWLNALDGPALRALEPLMDPWDPAAWEAVRLPVAPPTTTTAVTKVATKAAAGGRPVPAEAARQGELPLGPVASDSPAVRPGDPAAWP